MPMTAPRKKSANGWPAKLRHIRQRHRITQAEAAEKAGVSTRTWISWENSQRIPGRIAQRLLKAAFPADL